jgi:protein-S-isoprenylcysteine O-methyltransferase Ste14
VLQAVYVGLTFGWRTWLQYRATGDTGFRLSPSSPAADRIASALMVGGAALGVAGVASTALSSSSVRPDAPKSTKAAGARRAIGFATAAGAVATTYRAQLDMGGSWRVGVDHAEHMELVERGLFRRSRNPIFASMAANALATAAVVPNAATVAGAAMLVAGVQAQVRLVEEPYLRRVHGDAYDAYCRRVPRFVG